MYISLYWRAFFFLRISSPRFSPNKIMCRSIYRSYNDGPTFKKYPDPCSIYLETPTNYDMTSANQRFFLRLKVKRRL